MVAEEYLPVSKIISFVLSGVISVDDIAAEIELDTQFVKQIFKIYQDIHGYNYPCGDYIVSSFVPFIIIEVDEVYY